MRQRKTISELISTSEIKLTSPVFKLYIDPILLTDPSVHTTFPGNLSSG